MTRVFRHPISFSECKQIVVRLESEDLYVTNYQKGRGEDARRGELQSDRCVSAHVTLHEWHRMFDKPVPGLLACGTTILGVKNWRWIVHGGNGNPVAQLSDV